MIDFLSSFLPRSGCPYLCSDVLAAPENCSLDSSLGKFVVVVVVAVVVVVVVMISFLFFLILD